MSARWLAWACLPVALGCGAAPSADNGAATPAQTAEVVAPVAGNRAGQSAGPDGSGAAGNKGGPGETGAPASGATGAGNVPVATPAGSAGATASPAASGTVALTTQDREVIAMCEGKRSMFTEKELKLLDLADHSAEEALREHAANIRARRKEMLEDACARLRAEGKM